jgi:hypothetical protein
VIELVSTFLAMREELDAPDALAVGIDVDAKTVRAEAIYPRPEKRTLTISELIQRGIDRGLEQIEFQK